ncbi:MAG: leucine-rich repeat domain-containing protein [Clostridia bacterium]|nr:leucine-rich repeat domain-containing protein [Clostridia bacterium]
MRRIFAMALCLLLLVTAVPFRAEAAGYEEEGDFLYTVSNGQAQLCLYQGNDKIVEVPAELGGCPVVRIDTYAFKESSAEEVILPEGITDIGAQAFEDCASLKKINLPEGLLDIGAGAFIRCSALEALTFPSTLRSIGMSAFQKCASLEEVVLPEGFLYLQSGAFLGCTGLRKVVLPSTLQLRLTDSSLFQNCTALEEVILSEGFTLIPSAAFAGCTSLAKVELPSTLTRIDTLAFENCISLNRLTLPASLSTVGGGILSGCGDVELVLEQGSPLTYENGALYNESGFLVYARGMEELPPLQNGIESYAFAGNTVLKTAHIPARVTAVRSYAFRNCTALEAATVPWSVEDLNGTFCGCESLSSVNLYQGLEIIGAQTFAGCKNLTEIRLPEGLLTIGLRAFAESGLTSVYIPDTVTRIEQEAFLDCPNLTRIECGASEKPKGWSDAWVPEGVEIVWGVARDPDPAFSYGEENGYLYRILDGEAILLGYKGNDKELTLPATLGGKPVTEIWQNAFSMLGDVRGESMDKVVIPEGVKRIGEMAFFECGELSSVVLPDSLEFIGDGAFSGCALRKVKIPSSVAVIPADCFSSCSWLTEVEIPEGVTEIHEDAFRNSSLKTVSLPASVTEIHPSAFSRLQLLTSFTVSSENPVYSGWGNCLLKGDTVVLATGEFPREFSLPEGVRVIGENAFASAEYLKSVVLPSTLERIENGAFSACTRLTCTRIPEGVTYVGDRAFYSTEALAEVILPESLTHIGDSAFAGAALTSVYVPKGVTFIGREAFAYNDNLTELLFGATEKQEGWDETLAYRCPVSNSGNMKLGVKNPHASEDPEEDVSGETSGEISEEISEETSNTVSAPPAGTKSFPWILVGCAVGSVGILVVAILLRKRKQ